MHTSSDYFVKTSDFRTSLLSISIAFCSCPEILKNRQNLLASPIIPSGLTSYSSSSKSYGRLSSYSPIPPPPCIDVKFPVYLLFRVRRVDENVGRGGSTIRPDLFLTIQSAPYITVHCVMMERLVNLEPSFRPFLAVPTVLMQKIFPSESFATTETDGPDLHSWHHQVLSSAQVKEETLLDEVS